MQDAHFNNTSSGKESNLDIKEVLLKYLRYWPWFIATVGLGLLMAILYLKYTTTIYNTQAKIKIIDNSKELNIGTDAVAAMSGRSNINLDNEIEVLKSYRLLSEVVESLDLQINYYVEGNIKTATIWQPPFLLVKDENQIDTWLNSYQSYLIHWDNLEYIVTNVNTNEVFTQNKKATTITNGLPFLIKETEEKVKAIDIDYKVEITPFKQAVINLSNALQVELSNRNSEILTLSINGENVDRSEAIINDIIEKFNNDGIQDRQLVSKRTLDFIDERFISLSQELDSIEGNKRSFKQNNNLSYIEADAEVSLQKKSQSEIELFEIQTQIELSTLLIRTLNNGVANQLLPANIGLESAAINSLVSEYNQMLLEREKFLTSAGANNPTVGVLNNQITSIKANIVQTVKLYSQQLNVSLNQLQREKGRVGAQFSKLPEKEQLLRAIERQQGIKENLYLILLQKREEAAISLAVTAPSIKVVDYALTSALPIAPQGRILLLGAVVLGLLIPIGVLYLIFMLDTKIHTKQEVEAVINPIPVVAEIPHIEGAELFLDPDARTTVAEAFRMLMTNVNYTLPIQDSDKAKIIYVTSSIKGEGKTFTAVNLALAYASLGKRVLLIGADIRNPQVHNSFNLDKDSKGLTTYLFNPNTLAKDCILKNVVDKNHLHIMLGGSVPPNPAGLLSNGRFKSLLDALELDYDFIVVDTAPTVLVTDTLLISKHADVTVFVAKADFTEKNLLRIPVTLNEENKLKNIVFVINNSGESKHYTYNYNYGYGYNEDLEKQKPWYKRLFKR